MRSLLQRVTSASVTVEKKVVGSIEQGLLILLGFCHDDHAEKLKPLTQKIIDLRIFSDEKGKMNRSLEDVEGSLLVVSQFTLYGNCQSGRRPSFTGALPPKEAETLYDQFVFDLRQKLGEKRVQTGIFGAEMQVTLVNDGPVTFLIET